MKLTTGLLVFACAAACGSAQAQQRTTGDIISENFQRGRAMREALDERRARREEHRRAVEHSQLLDEERSANRAKWQAIEEQQLRMDRALLDAMAIRPRPDAANEFIILNSRHNVPRIIMLTFATTHCAEPARAAFTTGAHGEQVMGCMHIGPAGTFTIQWFGYGSRTYADSEWDIETRGKDANRTPLGH